MRNKLFKIYLIFIALITFISCEKIFEFSPYQANVGDKYKNTTTKNLDKIKQIEINDTAIFKFALIADNHYYYNNFRDAIDDINKNSEIIFVLHEGDITDQGLLKEYEIFYHIMGNLKIPYLTVIGNHDYKSNGGKIYKEMFGEYNYSFVFNKCKFIMFDDIVWESDKELDFSWLESELQNDISYNHVFVISHIPPFTDQFDSKMEKRFKDLIFQNNVKLSIHGHNHGYYYNEYYNNDVEYLIVPCPKVRQYCIITVFQDSYIVSNIEY